MKWLGFDTKVCSGSSAFSLEWEYAARYLIMHKDMDCDVLSVLNSMDLLVYQDQYYLAPRHERDRYRSVVSRKPDGAFGDVHSHNSSHYLLEYSVVEIVQREQFVEIGYSDLETALANSVAAMRIPNFAVAVHKELQPKYPADLQDRISQPKLSATPKASQFTDHRTDHGIVRQSMEQEKGRRTTPTQRPQAQKIEPEKYPHSPIRVRRSKETIYSPESKKRRPRHFARGEAALYRAELENVSLRTNHLKEMCYNARDGMASCYDMYKFLILAQSATEESRAAFFTEDADGVMLEPKFSSENIRMEMEFLDELLTNMQNEMNQA
ncbi:unnamed protein product [Nippostrongylus brasiliensis]|uniref:OTU domain-containing protein n=1 Tax=Nippostrongylus brasiliensis TaxID=27835 RepID=A0A158QZ49_NIPBR|nr:unnamed protein product [Nippostrongylus brasiliensis]